jgi:hypothetical protein
MASHDGAAAAIEVAGFRIERFDGLRGASCIKSEIVVVTLVEERIGAKNRHVGER